MKPEIRARAVTLFGAMAHPTRLRILEMLTERAMSVNELTAALGGPQSGTSQHLAVLTRAGLLCVDPRGTARFYRLRGPRIARIVATMEEFCSVHGLEGSEDTEE